MKKNRSVVPKLLLSVMAIVGIIFAIIAFILSATVRQYYDKTRTEKINEVSALVEQSVNSYVNSNGADLEQLNAILQFSQQFLNSDIIITDSQGIVFAVSNPNEDNLKEKKITNLNGQDILTNNELKYNNGNYNVYSKKIYYKNYFNGVMIVETPKNEMNGMLDKIYLMIWFFVILTLIILSIVVYAACEKFIIAPIEAVNKVSRKIADGMVGERVKINSNDELGELAKTFNTMADSIEQVELNRREFISNVSHELRSPMTSIKGFIAGILDGIIPPEKEHFYLGKVSEEIERLTRLISDLLDISAMQAGKLTFNFTKVDINEILKTSAINLEPKIRDKNLHVSVVLEEDYMNVKGDKDKLIQVVTNLLDNAIKYSPENGNIEIKTQSKGENAIVTIYNDSKQLSDDQLRQVWERFYKLDKSRTNKYSTGLGLAIVKNIVANHEQEVWVENSDDGKGVLFAFTLTKLD